MEEATLGEQWRWCLRSWSHSLRKPISIRGGSTQDSSLLATAVHATMDNWAAAAVGPVTPSLQLQRHP